MDFPPKTMTKALTHFQKSPLGFKMLDVATKKNWKDINISH